MSRSPFRFSQFAFAWDRCVLGQIAFALFSSLFFRLSLGSSGRKCSNKKVSRFLLVLSRWFRWWQLQPLKVNYHVDNFLQSERGCHATVRCQQKCLQCLGNLKRTPLISEGFLLWVHETKDEREGAKVNAKPWVSCSANTWADRCDKWPPYTTRCFFCTSSPLVFI